MKTYPFDNLDIDANVRQSANDVWDRMTIMIDAKIGELKTAMTTKAANAANKVSADAQSQLTQVLDTVDRHVANIEKALDDMTNLPVFINDPGLVAQSKKLQQAIADGQDAITAQRSQVQQYGELAGGLMQKALMAAL